MITFRDGQPHYLCDGCFTMIETPVLEEPAPYRTKDGRTGHVHDTSDCMRKFNRAVPLDLRDATEKRRKEHALAVAAQG